MNSKYKAPRGTQDILPFESELYQNINAIARNIFQLYGYREIQTPIFEHTELFIRGVGEATDIVCKEMYTFQDKKGRSLTLRPEGTAGIVRAYLENNLSAQNRVAKLYYIGPMFRYERPQSGRLRQHNQIGAEYIGSGQATIDAELIALLRFFIQTLGIKNVVLLLNTIGDDNCRPVYREKLKDYFKFNLSKLCTDCNERFTKNPLRILDCKNEFCQFIIRETPVIYDSLCADCREHFEQVQYWLKELNIDYKLTPLLVRGFDYYTRTLFEFQVSDLGAQNAIAGGGRYDNLVQELGGPATPALGFGAGVERLALTLKNQSIKMHYLSKSVIVLVAQNEPAINKAMILAEQLRQYGLPVELDHRFGSLKSQLKYADKLGARYVLILGANELNKNIIQLKNMCNGEQKEYPLDSIVDILKSTLI